MRKAFVAPGNILQHELLTEKIGNGGHCVGGRYCGQRTVWVVWRNGDIVSFGHLGHLAHLTDSTAARDVGHDDIRSPFFQYRAQHEAAVQPLAHAHGKVDLPPDVGNGIGKLGQGRLFVPHAVEIELGKTPRHFHSGRSVEKGMGLNGDGHITIWPTEFGWPVWRFTGDERFVFAKQNTEAEQAQYTVRAYQMAKEWGWVGTMFLWNLDYNITASNTELANFGIVGTATYDALANMPK